MCLQIKKYGLFFAWIIALIATLGSLFASEIQHFPVCILCWYQRICIYPLVILLGMAAYREDNRIVPYVLPFPVIGFCLATYQYLEQMIPGFAPIRVCTSEIPCDTIHFKIAGFVTLPLLSILASVLIIIFLWMAKNQKID